MRIFDNDKDITTKNATLFLTIDEMRELEAKLHRMIESQLVGGHMHITDSRFEHEITIALYRDNDSSLNFNERAKRVIRDDE